MTRSTLVDPRDTTGLDVSHLLTPEHRAHMAGLGPKYAMFAGVTMKKGDDPDPDDDDNDDDEEDEDEDDDPETEFRTGGKVFKVGDINRLMAREKRQGGRSALNKLAEELGFDSIDDLKAAAEKGKAPTKKKRRDDDEDEDDEAAERARQRESQATEREKRAAAKERRADLRAALAAEGVSREDMDEAVALLDRRVDDEYDEDDLDDAIDELRETRAGRALFDRDDEEERPAPRKKAAARPQGRGPRGRQRPRAVEPGAGGRARAKERGWLKDDE